MKMIIAWSMRAQNVLKYDILLSNYFIIIIIIE